MSSVCRIGSTIVVTYQADEAHWQYTVLHPERKFWGPRHTSHSKALVEGIRIGFQFERTRRGG